MNQAAQITTTHGWLSAAVRVGLLQFCAEIPHIDRDLRDLLRREIDPSVPGRYLSSWSALRDHLQSVWPLPEGALGRVIADYRLDLPQAFLLCLIGEVERSHLITLALSELQAPANQARPTVHLCVALMNQLFGRDAFDTGDLAAWSLLRDELVTISDTGPTPLCTLSLLPPLWSILCGRVQIWPGCRRLPCDHDRLLAEELGAQRLRIAALLSDGPGIVIRGDPGSGRGLYAAELAHAAGLVAVEVPVKLWEEEPGLRAACRYAQWLPVLRPDIGPGEVWRPPWSATAQSMAVILGQDGAVGRSGMLELNVPVPRMAQRAQLWARFLGDTDSARDGGPQIAALARQLAASALLGGPSIRRITGNARQLAKREHSPVRSAHIAEARRHLGVERLRLLAQPVHRRIDADALVLPALLLADLEQVLRRAQRRESLWQGLGATLTATPNPGVRCLFVGESGTGKTLAASYIATQLQAPLYRVDLSAVMNKYIGESEKNLAQLLDQAAASDVVLLFDEADSLFGGRSEGKETGERYANMLTNFLLSRIEHHPGIVILTTNNRTRIDAAFTRRFDGILEFPLPGFEERLRLWRSHLGPRNPGDVISRSLASYSDLAGGHIRNVVLTAAADSARGPEQPLETALLIDALQREYDKLGRSAPGQIERLRNLP